MHIVVGFWRIGQTKVRLSEVLSMRLASSPLSPGLILAAVYHSHSCSASVHVLHAVVHAVSPRVASVMVTSTGNDEALRALNPTSGCGLFDGNASNNGDGQPQVTTPQSETHHVIRNPSPSLHPTTQPRGRNYQPQSRLIQPSNRRTFRQPILHQFPPPKVDLRNNFLLSGLNSILSGINRPCRVSDEACPWQAASECRNQFCIADVSSVFGYLSDQGSFGSSVQSSAARH